jgi:hypothetical protein
LHFCFQILVEQSHLRAAAVVALFQLGAYPASLPKTIGPSCCSRMLTNLHLGISCRHYFIIQSMDAVLFQSYPPIEFAVWDIV